MMSDIEEVEVEDTRRKRGRKPKVKLTKEDVRRFKSLPHVRTLIKKCRGPADDEVRLELNQRYKELLNERRLMKIVNKVAGLTHDDGKKPTQRAASPPPEKPSRSERYEKLRGSLLLGVMDLPPLRRRKRHRRQLVRLQPSIEAVYAAAFGHPLPLPPPPVEGDESWLTQEPFCNLKRPLSYVDFCEKYTRIEDDSTVDKGGIESELLKAIGTDGSMYAILKSRKELNEDSLKALLRSWSLHSKLGNSSNGFLPIADWSIHRLANGRSQFIVATQFCPGGDLCAYLDNNFSDTRRMPVGFAINFTRQLISAVEQMEAAGIHHQDVKGQNILVFPDSGTFTLIDPGLMVQLTQPDEEDPQPDISIAGTPGYFSVEAFYRRHGVGSDRYAAAMSIIEVLANEDPWLLEWLVVKLFKLQELGFALESAATNAARKEAEDYADSQLQFFNKSGCLPQLFFETVQKRPEFEAFVFLVEELAFFHANERLSLALLLKLPLFTNEGNAVQIVNVEFREFAKKNGPIKLTIETASSKQLVEIPPDVASPEQAVSKLDKIVSTLSANDASDLRRRFAPVYEIACLLRRREENKGKRNAAIIDARHHCIKNKLLAHGFISAKAYEAIKAEDWGPGEARMPAAKAAPVVPPAAATSSTRSSTRRRGGFAAPSGGSTLSTLSSFLADEPEPSSTFVLAAPPTAGGDVSLKEETMTEYDYEDAWSTASELDSDEEEEFLKEAAEAGLLMLSEDESDDDEDSGPSPPAKIRKGDRPDGPPGPGGAGSTGFAGGHSSASGDPPSKRGGSSGGKKDTTGKASDKPHPTDAPEGQHKLKFADVALRTAAAKDLAACRTALLSNPITDGNSYFPVFHSDLESFKRGWQLTTMVEIGDNGHCLISHGKKAYFDSSAFLILDLRKLAKLTLTIIVAKPKSDDHHTKYRRHVVAILAPCAASVLGKSPEVNGHILDSCNALMKAISTLNRDSRALLQELPSQDQCAAFAEFYQKNHRRINGFLFAAKTIGLGGTVIIDSAAGDVAAGQRKMAELQQIAASLARLSLASNAKAERSSRPRPAEHVEASDVVTAATAVQPSMLLTLPVDCPEEATGRRCIFFPTPTQTDAIIAGPLETGLDIILT